MWKLMIADSLHLNKESYQPQIYFIIIYCNLIFQIANMNHEFFLMLWLFCMLVFTLISPVRIARGLYLCPLTEKERKDYLKTASLIRFMFYEVVFLIPMFILRFVEQIEWHMIILIFICVSIVHLTSLFLFGFYNPETVKKQYYITHAIPVPTRKNIQKEKCNTPLTGIYLLVAALILSTIGAVLPAVADSYHSWWLLFYIPALAICFFCLLFYFLGYFDLFITMNANYEMYHYTQKKKVGVFHAD